MKFAPIVSVPGLWFGMVEAMSYISEKLKIAARDNLLPGFLFRWRAALYGVPEANLYSPTYQPWGGLPEFRALYDEISGETLLNAEQAWILYCLAQQASSAGGDFMEAGVYRGGSARLLWRVLDRSSGCQQLHLFDTFGGMPKTDPLRDLHRENDFGDTSIEAVSAFVGGGHRVGVPQRADTTDVSWPGEYAARLLAYRRRHLSVGSRLLCLRLSADRAWGHYSVRRLWIALLSRSPKGG